MNIPFFLSAPRTRSTILYEYASFYIKQKTNIMVLQNHSELFLEFSLNAQYTDLKTRKTFPAEMYPIINRDNNIVMHFIYPYLHNNTRDRNLSKLDLLKKQRDKGYEYFFKGTLEVLDSYEEIIDFYKDRNFIITKRRNLEEFCLSVVLAFTTKIFNPRRYNKEMYLSILENGIYVNIEEIKNDFLQCLKYTFDLWNSETYFLKNGLKYKTVYYEDINTFNDIDKILGDILQDKDWDKCLPKNIEELLPIKIEKDYKRIIKNYDEVINFINVSIQENNQ